MLRPLLALCHVTALASGCGRSPLDLDLGLDGIDPVGSGEDEGPDDPPLPLDLPPPELGCEEQGGSITQIGGPWIVQSHIPDYAPAYGLLPGDDDMLAIWRGPFDGSNPMPNFLGAHVGYDGQLRSGVAPVWERPVTQEPAVHRAAEGWLLSYCGRFGASDEVTSQILDAQGVARSAEVIREPASSCGAARPEGVWTGQVYLFTWTDNSSGQLYLDVADPQLASVGWVELSSIGSLSSPPRIAVGATGALLVAGVGDTVRVYELGLDGRELFTTLIPLPNELWTHQRVGQLAVGARSDGGYTIFLADREEPGLYAASFDGGAIGLPLAVEGAAAQYSELLLLRRAGGFLLVTEATDELGGTHIGLIATDERGVTTAIDGLTAETDSVYEARPAAVMHGEDAWILYLSAFEDGPAGAGGFDVRLAQVGCVR